jgi:hypothetical protein
MAVRTGDLSKLNVNSSFYDQPRACSNIKHRLKYRGYDNMLPGQGCPMVIDEYGKILEWSSAGKAK